ncbi:hypothetical protein IC608_12835 [Devosia sp. PTR5]|uniref:Uncharacterized protein n=1 Tax=Devosia oryzisoli TaxID=2774138 RepID=A0A927FU63_9HYPH|nr:hypothetical protein [Devosia oryzisoli]MBD8066355.1 hypothetical protein [Devosia oryzisoli]
MSLELIDIGLQERHAHPRFPNRVQGKVRAVLSETIDGREQLHEIVVPAWTELSSGMSDEDVELALMVKAADIVKRVRRRLSV